MTYRHWLLTVALLAIVGIGLTAGFRPPGFLWYLAAGFVILVIPFILLIRADLASARELDAQQNRALRLLLHIRLSRRAGRDGHN